MKHLRSVYVVIFVAFLALLAWNCSPNQTTISGDVYHNTTAHFNGYFYAKEKIAEIQTMIRKSLDDDPNQILRLFPKLDTVLANTYKKDTEEAIKMASISIQRHPNSRWLDDNYLLVGLARLYSCDFLSAIQTFKYVNTKGLDPNVRHRALIHLVRTFTEYADYPKAEETIYYLDKEKLNKENSKDLFLEKAYYYQVRQDYDNMVRNLTYADPLLSRRDRKGRIYFIIGQVYQQLGFKSEAYGYYRKCLATNPEYEIDFYARLNLAQVAQLDNSKDRKGLRKEFNKLLSDTKNAEFKDKIYFELGEFERKQGNLDAAIAQYKLSAHSGKNRRIQGHAYLRIGQLYFDSLKRFALSKAYYDSAVTSLPDDTEGLGAITRRHKVLGQFVTYTETITWQDSLLALSVLDSTSLRQQLDSAMARRIVKEDNKKKRRKRAAASVAANQSAFFQSQSTSTTDWYFGNLSAVSSGQTEFQRIWGNISLEDSWRRSTRTATASTSSNVSAPQETQSNTEPAAAEDNAASSAEAAIAKIITQLPKTDEQKEEALSKIEEAYFKLGDLYYFQLDEKQNAEDSYEHLLSRFPNSSFKPEVLYKLYLIHKERGDQTASLLAQELKDLFPNSTYAKILLNPDYLKETNVAQEKQKMIYKAAYAEFKSNNLRGTQEKIKQARGLGETTFTPQLELLQILITGKTEDVTRYQFELGEFIKKYPDDKLHAYAETLLASSRTFLEKTERAKGIRFAASFEEPHYFVIVHRIQDQGATAIAARLELFHANSFRNQKLETINMIFNEQYALTFVGDLAGQEEALAYNTLFRQTVAQERPFSTLNFHNFVITKDNFNIFYRNKALDEYLSFFDRYYKK
ncbi:MAG: tetratricopeptide repeat protein [Cytophagales bacterium]|nr:tetratricopeptide repeat protein [Cytophagales bacterium]